MWRSSLLSIFLLVLAGAAAAAPAGKPKPLRIVAAVMVDANGNARAEAVRLTYSARIRHVLDRDGHFPFAVTGYRVRSVSGASGRTLTLRLVEHARPDPAARPSIRYRRTAHGAVKSVSGRQASAQLFRRVRPHRHSVSPSGGGVPPTTTTATTPTTTTAADTDHDGTPDAQDCAPKDPAVHPGALDVPDLAFVDSNCDGIDGTVKDGMFVAPDGNDASAGTENRPKRQIQAALDAGAKLVYVAGGSYDAVAIAHSVAIYGGYDADWHRSPKNLTEIAGAPQAVLVTNATVVLQLLVVHGNASKTSEDVYGIRGVNGAKVSLQRVAVSSSNASAGVAGTDGARGAVGLDGGSGVAGRCDVIATNNQHFGGKGGGSPAGRAGGAGGDSGGGVRPGQDGLTGLLGTPGGAGGASGDPGHQGAAGLFGDNGTPGVSGFGGMSSLSLAGVTWRGQDGKDGSAGQPGDGGGGGGGGGGQDAGVGHFDGQGGGGGGGGGGGAGGGGGKGGAAGGGSFGIYLSDSSVTLDGQSTAAAGRGGAGGAGGSGGFGGVGGSGGAGGGADCAGEVGHGGVGGRGGVGGAGAGGGGGAGGPSIGIFKVGSSRATMAGSADVSFVGSGAGGPGGSGGPGKAASGQPGVAAAVR
jgi:hypothetical protein